MDMGFPAERTHFPGVHKIDAPISGPRIADKNFTDTRIFLIMGRFQTSMERFSEAVSLLSGNKKTHKHKQICGIVAGLGGCQNFVYVLFLGGCHSLWGRIEHINKVPPPKKILGQSHEKFVYVFFLYVFFRSQSMDRFSEAVPLLKIAWKTAHQRGRMKGLLAY